MKFQELMRGAIASEQPVWILSGESSLPDSALAIVSAVGENFVVTSGAQIDFGTTNVFLMIGSTLFSLENCRTAKAPHGQFRTHFDVAIQVYPKVASGFAPAVTLPFAVPTIPPPSPIHRMEAGVTPDVASSTQPA